MFVEAIETILDDQCTPAIIRAIESGASPAPLWQTIEEAGFLELLTPESAGGAGLALAEVFPVMTCLGRHALPVPLGQSLLARALLCAHDASVPAGVITFAPAYQRADGQAMQCPSTPYGLVADTVLADQDGDLVVLSSAGAQRRPTGVRGSQCATLRWETSSEPLVRVPGAAAALHSCAAALHAALLAGAMNRVLEMTLQYANDRSQFGKPIGKFQAVQHQLAVMAEQVAAANIAAELGLRSSSPLPDELRAAIAKARTSEAVSPVAAVAHALHGAIGVTEEYDLHLYTRRLHEWRMAHGAEGYWQGIVGDRLLSDGHRAADFVREGMATR